MISMHQRHTNSRHDGRDLSKETVDLLDRIETHLSDFGVEDLQRRIIDRHDSADGLPVSRRPGMPGSGHPINVIPNSGSGGVCCDTVLAVAHGTRGPGGLGQVLRSLREHLIICANPLSGLATKTAILIYDVDVRRLFWESKPDLEAHRAINGVVFVKCYWDGKRLNVEI